MAAIKSVGVFCAASESIDDIYVHEAGRVGNLIGNKGLTLVYGGAAAGLMETTACAAKDSGAKIVGVFPQILIERNRVSTLIDERVVTHNLSDRKDNILQRSDILIALAGGIGTLDEVFHVAAAATIGYHNKKVIFYNINGFWDDIITLLHNMQQKGFIRASFDTLFEVANNIKELEALLDKYC